MNHPLRSTALALALAAVFPLPAQAADKDDLAEIRAQLKAMKDAYEKRIAALEARLQSAETRAGKAETAAVAAQGSATTAQNAASAAETRASAAENVATAAQVSAQAASQRPASAAAFNPEISLILTGTYVNTSQNPDRPYRIQGFVPTLGEAMPTARSFNLGESELAISANVDHLFRGTLRASLAPDNTVGVEEASIQTLGLGQGFNIKAGRFLSGVGYLNEQHPHEWDFADAPLPYQAFFGFNLGMDGVQARWLAPTETFFEIGAEAARARSFPSRDETRNKNGFMSGALFAHVGGDVGASHSWKTGLSYFQTKPNGRTYDDPLASGVTQTFTGTSKTWIADFVWKWAPQGNPQYRNFKVQGEYFRRTENGAFGYDDSGAGGPVGAVDGGYRSTQSGWYAQAVYQFMPTWRVGLRHDRLSSGNAQIGVVQEGLVPMAAMPYLESYNPRRNSVMVDWSPSEFSRVRLQYNRDQSRPDMTDNVIWLQYIMSLGAHGAHKF